MAGFSGTAGINKNLSSIRVTIIVFAFRFYQGRRSDDDGRQIQRWSNCCGEKGRWKNNLISKIVKAGCNWDNYNISPVVRQTLLHWGYELNEEDFNKNAKRFKK